MDFHPISTPMEQAWAPFEVWDEPSMHAFPTIKKEPSAIPSSAWKITDVDSSAASETPVTPEWEIAPDVLTDEEENENAEKDDEGAAFGFAGMEETSVAGPLWCVATSIALQQHWLRIRSSFLCSCTHRFRSFALAGTWTSGPAPNTATPLRTNRPMTTSAVATWA